MTTLWLARSALALSITLTVSVIGNGMQHRQLLALRHERTLVDTLVSTCVVTCPVPKSYGHPDADVLLKAAQAEGIPTLVYFAIVTTETRYNPDPPRGQSGEIGRLQITPKYWQAECDSLFGSIHTQEGNARCGAYVLRKCYEAHRSWGLAARCYNQATLGPRTEQYLRDVKLSIGDMILRGLDN